jgi:riboflavin kinase/FMN adenylyltransferase
MSTSATLSGSLESTGPGPRVVTIGTFDGVHLGHRHLIDLTVGRGRELGLRTTALTFEPIPLSVLRPELFAGRVCTADDKTTLLQESGVDDVVVLPFDSALAAHTPEEFMERLVRQIGLRELWVGEAFALGKGRAGNVQRLGEIGAAMGFALSAIARVESDSEIVSSSSLRRAIAEGNVMHARRLLGRPFRVAGEVIHGAHLGRTIGFPTANVVPPAELVPLADGIYVSLTTLAGEDLPRPSMTYVGTRPTVNRGDRLIETNILDFDGDLYGQQIRVQMVERLRADQHFDGLEALVKQLRRDEVAARTVLRTEPIPHRGD